MKTGIHIEGGPKGPHVPRLLTILEKIGLRATELGRDDVARDAVRALGELGGVRNVQISGASIGDGIPEKRKGGTFDLERDTWGVIQAVVESALCVGGPLDKKEVVLPVRSLVYWTDGERLVANTASTPPEDILRSRGFYQKYVGRKNQIMLAWKEIKQ